MSRKKNRPRRRNKTRTNSPGPVSIKRRCVDGGHPGGDWLYRQTGGRAHVQTLRTLEYRCVYHIKGDYWRMHHEGKGITLDVRDASTLLVKEIKYILNTCGFPKSDYGWAYNHKTRNLGCP